MPERDERLLTTRDLAALLRSAQILNQMGTLPTVLGEILGLAAELAESEAGSVLLHDRDRGDLFFAAAIGGKADEVMAYRVPLTGSIAGEVFTSRTVKVDNRIEQHYETVDRRTGFQSRSMVCVPLIHANEIKGVMQLLNKAGDDGYGDRDVALLERFGELAALAIRNAELYEQLISSSGLFARAEIREPFLPLLTSPESSPVSDAFTVLFADIRGFTKLCAGHPPERIKRMLDEYFTQLTEVVVEHDGIVNKIVGDGLLAVFGGASQCENAAMAALQLTSTFDRLRAQWDEETRENLSFLDLGVGIARDHLVLGRVGRTNCFDFTVIGHGVNFASALCDHARNGNRILCDQLFRHQMSRNDEMPWISYRKLDPISLANLGKDFDAYLLELEVPEFDVFLSYRRDGGGEAAHAIATSLRDVNVFLDVDSLRVGRFAPVLRSTIAATPTFVVLITKNSLDRCAEPGDWLTLEIGAAINANRRVVPVVWPDAQWPPGDDLPPEVRELGSFEAVSYHHDSFSATMDKLRSFVR